MIYYVKFFRLILKSIFYELESSRRHSTHMGIYFCGKKKRSLHNFILIDLPYIESQKYKLCNIYYSNLQLTYILYKPAKTTNLMVKRIATS